MADVTEQEMGTVLSIISRMSDPDQLKRIVEAVTSRRAAIGRTQINQIKVGQRVEWNGKLGRQTGTVLKVKQKWVEVKADAKPGTLATLWNVRAEALKLEQKKP